MLSIKLLRDLIRPSYFNIRYSKLHFPSPSLTLSLPIHQQTFDIQFSDGRIVLTAGILYPANYHDAYYLGSVAMLE